MTDVNRPRSTTPRAATSLAVLCLAASFAACGPSKPPAAPAAGSPAKPATADDARRKLPEPETIPAGRRRVLELDGGVRVEISAEGQGVAIETGDEVVLHYTLVCLPVRTRPSEAAEPATPDTPVLIEGAAASDVASEVDGGAETASAEVAKPAATEPPAETASQEPAVIASTEETGLPVTVRIGRGGPLLPALSRALEGLRAGTRATITIPAAAAYGAAGLASAGIPPGADLEAQVRIREVRK